MIVGLEKTVSLLFIILLGVLLRYKIKNKEQLTGIKVLILSVALPAIVFLALLKIRITTAMILLPVSVIGLNILLLGGAILYGRMTGDRQNASTYRTLIMLMPSLAPGLSCLPFITEFLGEDNLALAALGDVGNKVFVLIILYMVAMTWYYKRSKQGSDADIFKGDKLKSLLITLAKEPINTVIIIALIMLGLGLDINSLPTIGQEVVYRLAALMTPLVLLFIGMAVDIKRSEFYRIFEILMWRSGLAFIMSGIILLFLPASISALTALVIVAFPQSSCSFWPYAHMASIDKLEEGRADKTFDMRLALNVMAFSLPVSTTLILLICSLGATFSNPLLVIPLGTVLLFIASITSIIKAPRYIKNMSFIRKPVNQR